VIGHPLSILAGYAAVLHPPVVAVRLVEVVEVGRLVGRAGTTHLISHLFLT